MSVRPAPVSHHRTYLLKVSAAISAMSVPVGPHGSFEVAIDIDQCSAPKVDGLCAAPYHCEP